MTRFLLGLLAWVLASTSALAQSTVNPAVPATNAPLVSAPIRSNFAAATSDLNGILTMHAAATLGACISQTQTVGADCLVTTSPTVYQWYKYTGAHGYVLVATINPSTTPPTIQSGLSPIPNAQLIANCTGASAIPSGCTWSAFADQAIGASNGMLPYRTGGAWSNISTGVSGHTIPVLDGASPTFSNPISSGVAGTIVGGYCLNNATSGNICLVPTTGALGTSVATFPINSGVVAELNLAQAWTALQTFSLGAVVQGVGLTVVNASGTSTVSGPGTPLTINSTNNGTLLALQGSGTTVGLIGSNSAAPFFAQNVAGTNAFIVADDTSGGTIANQLTVHAAATASGVSVAASGSDAAVALTINAKGTGTIGIGSVSTGAVTITPPLTLSNALTYGGVTLSNAVTGTGNMVLSASPTLSGTLTAAIASFSGQITSTLATGTAPFSIASTTVVPNLNASFINGANFATPGPIGSGTPSTGAFTTLTLTTALSFANGGTNNAALTASNGGIVWSDASKLNVLAGTATARLPLISGATATPAWGAFSLPASVTSGGIPYFSSTSAQGSSALLTTNGVMIGGGAGNPPTTLAVGTNGQLLLGVTGAAPQMASMSQDGTITNAGVLTVTKTNNVAFTSYATAATGQLAGTATNDNASAGNIGEYNIVTGSAVSLSNATPVNVTSVSLPAGDWDVWGQVSYNPAATTNFTSLAQSIGTTSAAIVAVPTQGSQNVFPAAGFVIGNNNWSEPPVRTRFSFATLTPVFLVAQASFTVSTMTVSGSIQYRRAR